jgi:hypothetical protein
VDTSAVARILADAHARLASYSVIPRAPQRRFATWFRCLNRACDKRSYAAAVTDDGFATRHLVDLPARHLFGYEARPAGPRHFVVTRNAFHPVVVDLAGRVTRVVVSGALAPVVHGEVAMSHWGSSKTPWIAIDPRTGVAHPFPMPTGSFDQILQTTRGQLRVLSMTSYAWSDDGGATWHTMPLGDISGDLPMLVPTSRDDLHVVLLGGDGATLFPWGRILESTDGRSWTSHEGPRKPWVYVDSPLVGPDGTLIVDVDGWSDQRPGVRSPRPLGFYAVTDWSVPKRVAHHGPFRRGNPAVVVDQVVTLHTAATYAATPDGSRLFVSNDAAHWRPVRAR